MADIDHGQQQQQQTQQQPPAQSSQRSNAGSASNRPSGRSKQANPAQQLSTIEKSVTHLLVATKQLLETLTQWSRGNASESEVSDVYVRLGYEFNIACRAFAAIGVDTGDLGPVPDLLRTILEDTLSQEASQASLDRYLPRIRDIIINLLHGLKRKQSRLRMKENGGLSREGSDEAALAGGALPRQSSVSSNLSRDSSLTQQLEVFPTRTGSARPQGSSSSSSNVAAPPVDLPPRTTSFTRGTQSPRRTNNVSPQNSTRQSANRDTLASESGSSVSSNALQNIPVIAPYPETDTMPSIQTEDLSVGGGGGNNEASPAPPSKQNDALSALQRGGELERRASRRFSAYQIQKHLGTSGIAAIPPAQNSPIPNRGRDVRESLSAVRSRGNTFTRTKSRGRGAVAAAQEASPNRQNNTNTEVRRISEADEREEKDKTKLDTVSLPPPTTSTEPVDSPNVKTPEDKLGNYPFPETPSSPDKVGATVSGPLADPFPQQPQTTSSTSLPRQKSATSMRSLSRRADTQTPPPPQYLPESPPQPGKELTLFLQYKSKIKKFVLPDGGDLTIPRLQLAFIEKFAWNTHNNGVDLPEIYIQDPVSGVRHELEDLSDIRERSVLVLNVEALDEVKRHFDDGLGGIRRIIEGIRTSVDDQQSAIQRVSDRQQETARELAGIAAAPRAAPALVTTTTTPAATTTTLKDGQQRSVSSPSSAQDKASQLTEVQSLRRDLAVVRQTYTSFVSDMNASMAALRTKAASVKTAAKDSVIIPALDNSTGRAYVDNGKKQLSDDSEKIVNRVDDLQDIVEDLRKDVVTRGVRPLPRQLETVSKDISTATADLKKLQEFLKKEKPIWTKIWEKELQVVCDDRDLLTLQEELAVDLEDDLDKAAATFALVEQATKQQNLHQPDDATTNNNNINGPAIAALGGSGGNGSRNASNSSSVAATAAANLRSASGRTLPLRLFNPDTHPSASDPQKAKDSVLGEVRALQPNHESRLEAIERAERARQRELDSRKGGEFQRELGDFVGEGRLKKTGGVEEVERIRKVREDAARKEVLERQAQRMRERAEKEAAAAAAGTAGTAGADGQSSTTAVDAPAATVNGNSADVGNTASGAGTVPSLPALDIPPPLGRERSNDDISPEPRFEDAKEDVASPDAGTEVNNGMEDGKAF